MQDLQRDPVQIFDKISQDDGGEACFAFPLSSKPAKAALK
jgi:hypothetical protein